MSETVQESEPSDVETLAHRFGSAIADLPEYRRFVETRDAVEASEAAQRKLADFERVRREFMLSRQSGNVSQEEYRKLQEAQQELHAVPEMAEHLDAQSRLDERLSKLNDVVSEPLDIDFGREAGGCCED